MAKEFLLYSESPGDPFTGFKLEESLICILERSQWQLSEEWIDGKKG